MRTAFLCLALAAACSTAPELDVDAPFRDATRARVTIHRWSHMERYVELHDPAELRSLAAAFGAAHPGGPNHGASPRLEVVFERAGERVVVQVWSGAWETYGTPFWGGRMDGSRVAELEALLAGPRGQTRAPPPTGRTDGVDAIVGEVEDIVIGPQIVIDRENTWPWPTSR